MDVCVSYFAGNLVDNSKQLFIKLNLTNSAPFGAVDLKLEKMLNCDEIPSGLQVSGLGDLLNCINVTAGLLKESEPLTKIWDFDKLYQL